MTLDTLDRLDTLGRGVPCPCYPMLPDVTRPNLYHIDINYIPRIVVSPLMWQGDFSSFLSANRDPPWPHGSRKYQEMIPSI